MGLALYAAAFYILVGVFAPMALRTLRWKVVTLAFVATFALFSTDQVTHSPVVALAYTVGVATLAAVALRFWLKLELPQALKISGSYLGIVLVLSLGMALLLGSKTS